MTPAHKQTDPAKKPGQIVNPINTDIMDDMGKYASPVLSTRVTWDDPEVLKLRASYLTRRGNPVPFEPTTTPPLPTQHSDPSFGPKR